ncbi:MAG TPA: hypothetical protein VHF47_08545 [Acidimicrobiales bacterium]|nr:hypothetical protein [Acidimicrobiales bacterium]
MAVRAQALPHDGLHELAGRTRPVAQAGEQVLPVLPCLASLLPWAGLRRGATVAVTGPGATSLALALLAAASAAGSWAAAVGLPSLGMVAAAQVGVDLARFVMVAPGRDWPTAVAALVDAFDMVLVRPSGRPPAAAGRRLVARARERGAVLLVHGPWEGADLRLRIDGSVWQGLGQGYGHLRRRRVEVVGEGRGAAARAHRARLWLPDDDGRPASVRGSPEHARAGPTAVGARAG